MTPNRNATIFRQKVYCSSLQDNQQEAQLLLGMADRTAP